MMLNVIMRYVVPFVLGIIIGVMMILPKHQTTEEAHPAPVVDPPCPTVEKIETPPIEVFKTCDVQTIKCHGSQMKDIGSKGPNELVISCFCTEK